MVLKSLKKSSPMKKIIYIILFCLVSMGVFSQTLKNDRKLNTGSGADYLTNDEKEVIQWLNYIRSFPREFSEKVLTPYVAKNELKKSKYIKSLYKDLGNTESMALLQPSPGLTRAATYHANDMGKKGDYGHSSTNGWNMVERIENFVEWEATVGENCAYGLYSPLDIVLGLLIDEGVSNLGHRKNILNPNFKVVGIAIKPHKTYGTNCVQDFAGGVKGE